VLSDCDFYVRMRSGPIIEHSSGLRFAPYNVEYQGIESQLKQGGLDQETDMWSKVR